MTICYFGTYNPNYPRNRVLMDGLRKNGVNVVECNSRRPGAWKYVSLIFQFILKAQNVDAIIVGFPMGRGVVTLLKFFRSFIPPLKLREGEGGVTNSNAHNSLNPSYLKRETIPPVIIDGFVSQYDAEVFDRRHFPEDSQEAKRLFRWEQNAFRFASKVLVDTDANAEYYSRLFSIPREHFAVIPVGTDETLFKPVLKNTPFPERSVAESKDLHYGTPSTSSGSKFGFIVHFSGTYNPLQGIDVIVRAICLLKDKPIHFRLVGNGEEYHSIVQLAIELGVRDRIEFIDRVPYAEYARLTREADVCLGIFSDSPKAHRVIPNKVVEAMACGKSIITADTPAIRELLVDGDNVLLCKSNDPVDLSKKILELYQNEVMRLKLGENARTAFLANLLTEKIGLSLLKEFGVNLPSVSQT